MKEHHLAAAVMACVYCSGAVPKPGNQPLASRLVSVTICNARVVIFAIAEAARSAEDCESPACCAATTCEAWATKVHSPGNCTKVRLPVADVLFFFSCVGVTDVFRISC